MANKNIEDFFGEKKRDNSKCKNILDLRLRLKLTNIETDFDVHVHQYNLSLRTKKTYFGTLYL